MTNSPVIAEEVTTVRKLDAWIVSRTYYTPTGELASSHWWDGGGELAAVDKSLLEDGIQEAVGVRITLKDPAGLHTPLAVEVVDRDERHAILIVKYVSGVKRGDTDPTPNDLITPQSVALAVAEELARRGMVVAT